MELSRLSAGGFAPETEDVLVGLLVVSLPDDAGRFDEAVVEAVVGLVGFMADVVGAGAGKGAGALGVVLRCT